AIESFKPDIVHIDHLQMAQFVEFDKSYKVVLDNHNVESTIIKRVAETSDSMPTRLYAGLEWPKLQRYEVDICNKCDLVLTVSETDKDSLTAMGVNPAIIESVPIGVDVDTMKPVDMVTQSRNILSLGTMSWPPNIDSMLYFVKDVMPIIRDHLPGCTLTIAGSQPSPAIQSLESEPDISVTGFVEDIDSIARKCGVFIVPLRSGSGVRVKILNALAMGLPIVSTSIGAEGLDVRDDEHLLIADTPHDFANSVIRILTDPDLAQTLGLNGRAFVCDNYSWETTGNRLLQIYEDRFQPPH
ncbi:MAG: glycosyltransferase family 4 protein, partial [Armatimonadota bacterium]